MPKIKPHNKFQISNESYQFSRISQQIIMCRLHTAYTRRRETAKDSEPYEMKFIFIA